MGGIVGPPGALATTDRIERARAVHIAKRVGQFPGYPLASIPRRKRELIAAGVDVIDVGAGDPVEPPPAIASEALAEALRDPAMSKYGFQLGLPAFREAVVRYHQRRFGTAFDPMTEVLPLIGSKEGLAHFALATTNPGDVVIVPEPGYQCYIGGAIASGAEARIAPLTPEADFLVELGELPRERAAPHQPGVPELPEQPHGGRGAARLPRADRGGVPGVRHRPGVRQPVRRDHLRRVPGAEHLRDRGRARGGGGVPLVLEVVHR